MIDRAAAWLFPNGFGFIVPYVAVYLLGRVLDLPPAPLGRVFLVLHAVNGLLLMAWALPRLRRADRGLTLFWLAWAAIFLGFGAYLEFPSDPWEHARRIYEWGTTARLSAHDTADKFAYFWGWTWLGRLPIEWRPAGLAAYGAFWQLLLAWQFYRLARALEFSRGWSAAQVAGTIALFGTNLFPFSRYYALSSAPLAYIAYLHGLGAVLDPTPIPAWRRAAWVALAAVVAWANHLQELLFLVIMVPALLVFAGVCRLSGRRRTLVAALAAAAFLGSLGLGAWLRARHPALYTDRLTDISALGTYRLWDVRTTFFETLALHGWLGILAACAIARARPRLALLTLLPVALTMFPPFVLFGSRVFPEAYVAYRVLYAFPSSLALVAALERLTAPGALRAGLAGGLAVMSLIPAWPVRGRLYLQFYVPPGANRLVHLYPVAVDLARRVTFAPDCLIATDRVTLFFLTTHLGLRLRLGRVGPFDMMEAWRTSPSLDTYSTPWIPPVPVCAAVLLLPEQVPESPGSPIGRASRHWAERAANPRAFVRGDVPTTVERLEQAGWWPVGPTTWLNPNAVASGRALPRQAGADPQH